MRSLLILYESDILRDIFSMRAIFGRFSILCVNKIQEKKVETHAVSCH